ncbi:hypothetical protein QBC47DRAFT_402043 [Echria macrotheca]|uniref:Uncharacterized protein n=1 Tax=Echria macrotheca TaxID=438768 RepID=A0AAJ0FBY5_9PEZI|nr:hypothetical protein QBC47DRAFT_402043 [Echria macrotheca]
MLQQKRKSPAIQKSSKRPRTASTSSSEDGELNQRRSREDEPGNSSASENGAMRQSNPPAQPDEGSDPPPQFDEAHERQSNPPPQSDEESDPTPEVEQETGHAPASGTTSCSPSTNQSPEAKRTPADESTSRSPERPLEGPPRSRGQDSRTRRLSR